MAGHVKPQESSKLMLKHDNVAGGRLAQFSMDPPTGYFRDGYCRVTDEDMGNHSVAGLMTPEFLRFTNGRGNNLESAGVKPGMKWCLCAARWKEAYEAYQDGTLGKEGVPQVALHASDKKALDVVSYKAMSLFKAAGEATREGSRQGVTINPESASQSHVNHGDISGSRPGSDQHYGKTEDKRMPTSGAESEQARRTV